MEIRTSLLLISRHTVMTNGLRVLFEAEPDLTVLGEIPDSPGAIRSAASVDADVIVFDLIAQAMNGLSAIRELKRCSPRSAIVTLSMCTEESFVSQALQNGASAYVLKSESFAGVLRAVREVAAGRQYLSAGLDAEVIRHQVASGHRADTFETLTARERQVLQLAAQGRTSAQIAMELGISPRTAEAHRANIYKKLRLSNHAELIAFAARRGLLTIAM